MPSGPPELHEKWCAAGDLGGDGNAQKYLCDRGWTLLTTWQWREPTPGYSPTPEEISAINYLMWEWDFGGIVHAA